VIRTSLTCPCTAGTRMGDLRKTKTGEVPRSTQVIRRR